MNDEDDFLKELFLKYSKNRSVCAIGQVGVFVENDTLSLHFWTDPQPQSAWIGSFLSVCFKDQFDQVLWKIARNEDACNGMLGHTIYEAPNLHQALRDQIAELDCCAREKMIEVDRRQFHAAHDFLRAITTPSLLL